MAIYEFTTMGINDYFTEYYGEKIIKPNIEVYNQAKGIYIPQECIIVGDDKIWWPVNSTELSLIEAV